ncbi:type 1 fimbrial protein [Salmonella enterica subsp. enterica]|uniref:Type 1 fimbrial protein n=2 Tax=Salmonella enterica TaxID=28901 RepID=A0A760GUF8_SALER|nr:type 1 fimbrial protein [Salmonella enterica subsp. enterica serovar Bispebjerg]EAB5927722.1 type 1 fimbrial protein [Salmonella enterica subsp. enterica serovar Newport]EBX1108234.1 type 1 fimbrial protein [Salmonella enterica subsp. enterica serovar Salford]ECE6512161.1 type 1 fimbrial protein [Salmonella enterica subsp. enterica]ECM3600920.1 type 1 fimbrial protein [Salmonella enterica subsp. enterica serovar Senftenberg]EDW1096592.1 type 1 fimbrial protein [Salmonella enterica subsp. en
MRLYLLPLTGMLLTCLLAGQSRADKVADGSVSFTGTLLGKETCTLVNPDINVDFGIFSVDPGATPEILTSRDIAFHFTKCPATTNRVLMTVDFNEISGGFSSAPYGIYNQGSSSVMGTLACNAGEIIQAGVFGCPSDHAVLRNFSQLTGIVHNDGTLFFPLTVSLAAQMEGITGLPLVIPGTINMIVNFTFEEM